MKKKLFIKKINIYKLFNNLFIIIYFPFLKIKNNYIKLNNFN